MKYVCYILSCFVFMSSYGQSSGPLLPYVQPLVGTAASTVAANAIHGKGTEQYANTIPRWAFPLA